MERGFCKSRKTVRLFHSLGLILKMAIWLKRWSQSCTGASLPGWAPQAEQCCTEPVWPGRLTGKESVTRTCHPGSRGHGGTQKKQSLKCQCWSRTGVLLQVTISWRKIFHSSHSCEENNFSYTNFSFKDMFLCFLFNLHSLDWTGSLPFLLPGLLLAVMLIKYKLRGKMNRFIIIT